MLELARQALKACSNAVTLGAIWLVTFALVSALSSASARAASREITAVPIAGGDSDVGFGGGYLLSYARTPRGYEPYLWRIESAGAITFKGADPGDGSGVEIPYIDDYVLLQWPHVRRNRFEVELRLSYTREAMLKFYGLGNASLIGEGRAPTDSYFEHSRVHPMARWLSTLHVTRRFDLIWGLSYTYNRVDVPPGTLLAERMQNGSAFEKRLLGEARPHSVAWLSAGFAYDTRDDEITTSRGQYHTVRADLAPGGVPGLPYRWGRVTAEARLYAPLVGQRLVLAVRAAGDLLFGDAPFYELPRYDNTYFGGGKGIRGVPAQRYWGKVKLFSTAELRGNLFSAHFWNKTNWFGLAAFFDSGRLWTDYRPHPELDGTGVGLKYGVGGGLRLTAGNSFVLRADIAYSPDARPIAGYLTSGQMF